MDPAKNASETDNTAETMLKINKLLSSRRLYLCQSKGITCSSGPPGPPGPPGHKDTKEPGDGEDRKEKLETREIEALWGRQENAASKASWDQRG